MISGLLPRVHFDFWLAVLVSGTVSAVACGLSGCDGRTGRGGSAAPATAPAGDRLVEIDGGLADDTRQNYQWTVTNRHTSPIVCVEFPHYHADMFIVPEGWSTRGTTYLVNVGVPDKPGVCVARPEASHSGIPPGGARRFGMRIAASGALVGEGNVTVRFADGSATVVSGVVLPVPPPYNFKFLPLVGAAIIFVAWVMIRTIRDRRRASVVHPNAAPAVGDRQDAENSGA